MSHINVNRSVQFVSLDTHPVNNALVVTYEISVAAFDQSSGQELRRGSKRHQFQVRIRALDELKDENLRAEKTVINLEALSRDILRKCELLEHQRLEEIQLHLLYLVNRRRAQVAVNLQSVDHGGETSGKTQGQRPLSQLSHRLGRLSAGSIRTNEPLQEPISSDVYMNYLSKEQQLQHSTIDRLIGSHLVELDTYLQRLEELNGGSRTTTPLATLTDSHIEAIYGGEEERQRALGHIRSMCREDSTFETISSNRLLVCALLTALVSASSDLLATTKLSILFCLIRYTMFSDVFLSLSGPGEPVIDVAKPVLQQLQHHLTTHLSSKGGALSEYDCFLINSLLLIVVNLLRLSQEEPKLICPQLSQVLMTCSVSTMDNAGATVDTTSTSRLNNPTLVHLFVWLAKRLERDLRLLENIKATVNLLSLTLRLLLKLSVFREFLGQIRGQSEEQLIDSLVSLLNTVQLNRPQSSGLGRTRDNHLTTGHHQHELYMLEMELMKLVNNLIADKRLKLRLMKRKLVVKCVLRSLAMFMANRAGQQSLIGHFKGSSVLVIPTRILYEISCEPRMLTQLYRSKLIIKCLLEYLVSAVCDSSKEDHAESSMLPLTGDARMYIVALWINLASKAEAPMYSDDPQLNELLLEYIHLAIRMIEKQVANANTTTIRLPVYIHSKLLRILTHFTRSASKGATSSWSKSLASSANDLVDLVRRSYHHESLATIECYAHSLLVECVACLSNLMDNGLVESSKRVPLMSKLVARLFTLLSSDSRGAQSDKDDLLLVSIVLMGNLARHAEICPRKDDQQSALMGPALFWEPFQTTCLALKSQPMDREMLICGLYSLQQLLRHVAFREQFWPPQPQLKLDSPALETSRNLASLLLNGDKQLSRLSVSVLEQINQLELARTQQETELVRLARFQAYNERWLSTIEASRRQDLGSTSLDLLRCEPTGGAYGGRGQAGQREEADEEEEEDEDDDYELSHLRALAFESSQTEELIGDGATGNNDNDDSDFEASGQEEPDLNVIDANSMIKHLTARRELRFTRDSV